MNESVIINEEVTTLFIEEDNTTLEIIDDAVEVVSVGVQGPPGTNGASVWGDLTGDIENQTDLMDAFNTYGDKNHEYALSGQTDVTIAHNLNKFPAITVFDSAGDEVEGEYKHIDENTSRLQFSSGFSGKVIFN